jgi:hypothetical protein
MKINCNFYNVCKEMYVSTVYECIVYQAVQSFVCENQARRLDNQATH